MAEQETVLLTKGAYDKMKKELELREGEMRREITQKIKEARAEGDLSENGGYQAAKEEQGRNEGRIVELTQKLRSAKILSIPDDGRVHVGSVVKLKVANQEVEFLVGSRDLACANDKKGVSPDSPMGAAILDHKAGDVVSYRAPGGREMKAEILEVSPLDEE